MKQARQIVTDYLCYGIEDKHSPEMRQRIAVSNLFGFIGYSITGIMGILALIRADWVLAVSLLAASALFFGARLVLTASFLQHKFFVSSNIIMLTLMSLMLYLVYTGGVSETGPLWIYIVPPVVLFFGGIRHGLRNLFLFVAVLSIMLYVPIDWVLAASYSEEYKSRLLYSFFTVSALFTFYEYSRQLSYESLQLMTKRYEEQARRDPLSGLQNRRGMLEKLEYEHDRSQRYYRPISIMMCDIDHFKSVNDRYGHEAGDRIIKGLAEKFSQSLRKQDVISRWGGEEFLILLPETALDQAHSIGEKLRVLAEQAEFVNGENGEHAINVTVSIGIYQFSKDDKIDDAIAEADNRLYVAKEAGRNRCVSVGL